MKKVFSILVTILFLVSCSSDNNDETSTSPQIGLPTLTTTRGSLIATATASSGGDISSDGGGEITGRGVVWSTNLSPTISLSTKTSDGIGTGAFTSAITGLTANTTYYIKAYATNSAGTAYGNQVSFKTTNVGTPITDIDGNTYETVVICNQTWTKTNLNVSKYRNGDVIPQVTDQAQWSALTTGAWCYYENNSSNGTTYGKLYNWYAVNDPRGLAPEGFHLPTYAELNALSDCLGGFNVGGGKMKETGTTHWESPNIATNSSGFTGLPGGSRQPTFNTIGYNGSWWGVNTSDDPRYASYYGLQFNDESIFFMNWSKSFGLSVRCIKD